MTEKTRGNPGTLALGDDVMSLLDVCQRTARRTFGIERLRPEQESAMVAILEGRDALVALPTGFGKSLIYQVPAMAFGSMQSANAPCCTCSRQ